MTFYKFNINIHNMLLALLRSMFCSIFTIITESALLPISLSISGSDFILFFPIFYGMIYSFVISIFISYKNHRYIFLQLFFQ